MMSASPNAKVHGLLSMLYPTIAFFAPGSFLAAANSLARALGSVAVSSKVSYNMLTAHRACPRLSVAHLLEMGEEAG